MTTTFVHIGDTHLHAGHSRNAARLRALDQIIDEGLALENLGAWLWPGDLFDAKSGIQDRVDLAERLQRMASRAPVVIAVGNHDSPGDLPLFGRLRAAWPIYVIEQPGVVEIELGYPGGTAAIAVLPHPSKGGLIAAGTVAGETLQAGNEALESIVRGLAMQLDDARGRGSIPLFIAHLNLAGSIASAGQPQVGKELELAPSMLGIFGDCYKGLSHIHEPQTIGGAYYAGSIAPMDWGEVTPRSYIVVEYQREGDHWEYCVGRRPIDTPRLFHVDGELCRGGDVFALSAACSQDEEVKRRFLEGDWAGCEVRVRFSFPASERQLVDEPFIGASFPGALRLELEPVAVPDRALRAPEVATAKTLAGKLDAWARLDGGRSVPASVIQKLAALETGDPTSVLSAVANQVSALEQGEKESAAA